VASLTALWGHLYDFMTEVRPQIIGGALAPMLALQVRLRDESKIDEAVDFILKSARQAHRGLAESEEFRRYKTLRLGALAMQFDRLTTRTVAFGDYAQFDPEQKYFAGEL